MIIIRPIRQSDRDIFANFSYEGMLGMTNLPHDRDRLLEKILISERSFSQTVEAPGKEEYYFVLEDLTTHRAGGTCGIIAQNNNMLRFYYQIEKIPARVDHFSVPKEVEVMKIVPNRREASEVCALYLLSLFRHSGLGRLLSLSRFLFIAAHPHRFGKKIDAEMRGYIDQRQTSPFWEGIGRHFCNLSFVELMALFEVGNELLPHIIPSHPIYTSLLPKEVQEVIGKTHDNTKAAYQMLIDENFSYHGEVDFFEGGPILTATTSEIRAVSQSFLIQVEVTHDKLDEEMELILSNEKLDFRACFGKIRLGSESKGWIHADIASALEIKSGDTIRCVSPH